VGVNIHFITGHEKDLDLIAAAGFKFIRMDFGWAGIERKKGEYSWSEYDELLANLDRRGMRAILILDYSNQLYEQDVPATNPLNNQPQRTLASPQHPESVAAFARWAAAAASHFHGRHVLWEIWNEPNIFFWAPKPDVTQYTTLALATCKAIREAEPEATIVGPATSELPWTFLETFLKSGALEYLDAVSVHPYRRPQSPPETSAPDFERLRQMIDRYAPPARQGKIPILSGEWGYSSFPKGVTVETQAAFAGRQQLANLLSGVPISIWYDWKNDGEDPNEREHNFGTVQSDLTPKPAYVSLKILTSELSGYRISKRLALESKDDYVLLCADKAGREKLAAWTLGQGHQITLTLTSNRETAIPCVNSHGQSVGLTVESGAISLELEPAPKYVSLGNLRLKEN
jgi:hypothetical protein